MSFWSRSGACSNKRHSRWQSTIGLRCYAGVSAVRCAAGASTYAHVAEPAGMIARLDITQRLQFSSNPDLAANGASDTFGRTILGFSLESVTREQRFTLTAGSNIDEGRSGKPNIDVTNSNLSLAYARETRNARFSADFSYRQSDISSSFSVEEFGQDGNVLIQDRGKRKNFAYGLGIAVGQEAPIGASIRWSHRELKYSGTTNPRLLNSQTDDFSGQIDFRIDPRITASLTGRKIYFDVTGAGVDRETTGIGAQLNLVVTPISTVNMSLSYDKIERSGTQTGANSGLSGGSGWSREMPNGTLGLSYRSDVASNQDGRRSVLTLSRSLDLPRGALSAQVGLTGAGSLGTNPLVSLSYNHEFPTAALGISVSQSLTTDNNNNEEINTTLRANYNREINDMSSFGLSGSVFDSNELSATGNDAQRIDLSVTYRHDLPRDFGLVGGITHSRSSEDGRSDRSSNTVFVGLQRSFDWTP